MLSKECIEYVQAHLHEQPAALLLRDAGREWPFPIREAVMQVECRRKCRAKIPGFLAEPRFRFADALSAEQASHEYVARYHASLTGADVSVIDMTAGLGIDAMSVARAAASVTALELDPARAEALADNAQALGISNLQTICADSVDRLRQSSSRADIIFIDPARRDAAGRRTYGLADCVPDVTALRPLLLSRCRRLLVKASPLLDVTQTLRELPETAVLRVVSVAGECKEVLVEAAPEARELRLVAVDIDREGRVSEFEVTECGMQPNYLPSPTELRPGMYLYEPSASVMKLAPWGALCARHTSLRKLAPSTHLFVSEEFIAGFPGRALRIESIPSRAELKSLKGERINVVTRNHPLAAPQLEKKLGVKPAPSASRFIYGFRAGSTPCLAICSATVS